MSWLTKTLGSSLGKKLLMSLTGIFLITFLPVHLIGNLQLLKDDGGMAFNVYAEFMTTNPIIKTTSYILYSTFILHILLSLRITIQNRGARGEGYAVNGANTGVSWNSKNMGVLGTLVLVFLIIHLKGFWYEMHWGEVPIANYDGESVKDLYAVVNNAYAELWYVVFYVIAMVAVAFHLYHGFQSAFQTLGLNHKKYTPTIKAAGVLFSLVIPALFALIPIFMYLKN